MTQKKTEVLNLTYTLLKIGGMVQMKSIPYRCYSALLYLWLFCGIISNAAQVVVLAREGGDILILVEAVHWAAVETMFFAVSAGVYLRSEEVTSLRHTAQSGLFKYRGDMTVEQKETKHDSVQRDYRIIRIFIVATFCACFASMLRDPLFGGDITPEPGSEVTRLLFYPTWLPFKVNTWRRYAVASVFHCGLGIVVILKANAILSLYVSYTGFLHYEIKVLQLAFKEAYVLAREDTKKYNGAKGTYQVYLYRRLRDCVVHHQIILRFFEKLRQNFSLTCFVIFFNAGIILCTFGYIVTGPESNYRSLVSFVPVVCAELILFFMYCFNGQRIQDQADEIRNGVYNTPWFEQPAEIQNLLLMVMIRTRRPLIFTGLGIKQITMASFSDIFQTSYSYFNMLSATRN